MGSRSVVFEYPCGCLVRISLIDYRYDLQTWQATVSRLTNETRARRLR
jgi:hypothetical protein